MNLQKVRGEPDNNKDNTIKMEVISTFAAARRLFNLQPSPKSAIRRVERLLKSGGLVGRKRKNGRWEVYWTSGSLVSTGSGRREKATTVIIAPPLTDGEKVFITPQVTGTVSSGYLATIRAVQTRDGKHIVLTDAEPASSETGWAPDVYPDD